MFMNAAEYRESLRRHSPRVFVDGARIESVADAPQLQPGIDALGVSYDFALRDELAPIMRAVQASSGKTVNRMLHVDQSSADLLNKLEAVRVLCQETGCAQRYLAHDAFSAIAQSTARVDAEDGTRYGERFTAWLHDFQDKDLAVGIAMTDAKGDRSKRPHEQANVDSYVHIVERNAKGIVLSGTKAIVTGAPYMHEFLVMPCRGMGEGDAAFAVCCAVPCDADGLTIVARPAGRPGEKAALFSSKYGQSTGVLIFDRVFVPWERVFLAGEWQHSAHLTYSYATHHRHTCIAARAGFGDLLIGAGALMCEANGFDPGRGAAPARADGPADHDRRGLLRVRRRGERLRGRRRAFDGRHARSGVLEHRQAVAREPDLRDAPDRPLRLGWPDRHACPGPTRTTTRRPRRALPTCCAPIPTFPTTSGSRRRG